MALNLRSSIKVLGKRLAEVALNDSNDALDLLGNILIVICMCT